MVLAKIAALKYLLANKIKQPISIQESLDELTISCNSSDWKALATVLRDDPNLSFEQCMDLCAVDYSQYANQPWQGKRFAVVIHLLSIKNNWRVRLKTFADNDEKPQIDSLTDIWNGLVWFEREAFDLFGVIFLGHPDLRRILTDYGFIGHPFRKDFPVSGYVEMRYDEEQKSVIYQPVSIEPREVIPRVVREDEYGKLHD